MRNAFAVLLALASLALADEEDDEVSPPPTRVEVVVDDYHGHEIADPYRWLEDGDDPEVAAWVAAQNAFTRRHLDRPAVRRRVEERLAELLAIGAVGSPVGRGRRVFLERRDGGQDQPVLVRRDGGRPAETVVFDPNDLDADGLVSLDWWVPSPDGRLLAFGLSEGGSERSVLGLLEVESGRRLPDRIEGCRAASIAWLPDGSAFYYTRYPSPEEVGDEDATYDRRIFLHRLGDDPAGDRLVFGEGRERTDWPGVTIDPAGRRLLISVFQGWSRSELHHLDLTGEEATIEPLVTGIDDVFWGDFLGPDVLVGTNHEAPRYRLVRVDPDDPSPDRWRPFLAESEATIKSFVVTRRHVVVLRERDARGELLVLDHDGKVVGPIELPAMGSIHGLSGEATGDEVYFGFSSFFLPPVVFRFDLASMSRQTLATVEAGLDTSAYRVRQVRYPSADGTLVPMFLIHRVDLEPSGEAPTLLTGYGGFNISLTPGFSRNRFLWLEAGGVLAVANLRGGGELGERWHEGGMLGNKQNTFDDFIAAAEWLVEERYTRPGRLAIRGGSNGGLLVGAALTQRPDLFRAVVCSVPLLDMLRYHRFLLARLWIPEYGSSEDPEQFAWLAAYSPYHRVVDRTEYPAVLLMTAERDTRVDPCHARKMAARLQAATGSEHPILLRVETAAGHGAGKPLSKVASELADEWTFLLTELEVEYGQDHE